MEDFEKLTFNGHQWLHTMLYGVSKQHFHAAQTKQLRGKSIADILVEGGEAERTAAKLRRTQDELQGLLRTQVTLTPIKEDGPTPTSGVVERIDLKSGTLTLLQGNDRETVAVCEVAEHDTYGFEVTPLVTMQAEKTYKF